MSLNHSQVITRSRVQYTSALFTVNARHYRGEVAEGHIT